MVHRQRQHLVDSTHDLRLFLAQDAHGVGREVCVTKTLTQYVRQSLDVAAFTSSALLPTVHAGTCSGLLSAQHAPGHSGVTHLAPMVDEAQRVADICARHQPAGLEHHRRGGAGLKERR